MNKVKHMLFVNQNGKINNMTRLEKLKIAIDKASLFGSKEIIS